MSGKQGSVRLVWAIVMSGSAIVSLIQPGTAQEKTAPVLTVQERDRAATTVKEWMAQVEAAFSAERNSEGTVRVTGVRLDRTAQGLQVVLETESGQTLQATQREEGNALIVTVPNAVLALSSGQAFEADKPADGISRVTVSQADATSIQIRITGLEDLPTADVVPGQGLVLAVTPEMGEEEEITVTGEGARGYRVPNASTATRTDTPIRDIPQTVRVVPQEVLRDQNATRLDEALRNVPGVVQNSTSTVPYGTFNIRGFDINSFNNNNFLRNGFRDPLGSSLLNDLADTDRIEVLSGPTSVLYGGGAPGGVINLVTKQPLTRPFYAIDAAIGSYDFYRGAIDLSGPLNDAKTVAYRLNAAYSERNSFINFYEANRISIAPTLSFALSGKTRLTLEGDYNRQRLTSPYVALPAIGTVLPNPNGKISRDFFPAEPDDFSERTIGRVGYRLEHQISNDWTLRNAFRATFYDLEQDTLFPTGLAEDNRTLERIGVAATENSNNYSTTLELNGKFLTGSVIHQLVFGIDLARFDFSGLTRVSDSTAPIDLFNPVYNQTRLPTVLVDEFNVLTETLGIYLQNQIALTKDLRLVLGGRFDTFRQSNRNLLADTESKQSDSAFSPFVGIVYKPVNPISLYASYSRSFTPIIFGTTFGDGQLQPESATQYEIGIKADLSDRLSATLALYELTRSNVLTNDLSPGVPPGFSIQTGEQRSRGIELNVTGELLPGWNVIAGYAYTDARVTKDNTFPVGNSLRGVPENAINLWTTYTVQSGNLRGLGFGLGLFFVGDRQGNLENTFEIPNYLRTDATIYYQRDRFRAALNFRNLFDVEYFEASDSAVPVAYGEPFTVQGTVSWQF